MRNPMPLKKLVIASIIVILMTLLVLNAEQVLDGSHKQLAAGRQHVHVIKSDGSLWGWGNNETGQIGDGSIMSVTIPMKIMDKVNAVDSAWDFVLAIKTDNSLWAWGDNYYGQLGDGTRDNKLKPTKVLDNVMMASAGRSHSTALKTDGSLWTWGRNFNGQLGDGTTKDHLLPIKIMDNVASVYSGLFNCFVIKQDNSLWAWGDNFEGILGDGTVENRLAPVKIMENVTYVSSSPDVVCVIKTDKTLWTWGVYNKDGQLGDGTTQKRLVPVQILDDVISVSAGNRYCLAVKSDGSLWAWGWNEHGQLGDGSLISSSVPIKVMDDINILTTGSNCTLVVNNAGTLFGWGETFSGQLGKSDQENLKVPVQILENVRTNIIAKPTDPVIQDSTIVLPQEVLFQVNSQDEAKVAVSDLLAKLTSSTKTASTVIDLCTLFSEEAIAQSNQGSNIISDVVLNQENILLKEKTIVQTKAEVEKVFADAGVILRRDIETTAIFTTTDSKKVDITIEPNASNTVLDQLKVKTPTYSVTIGQELIEDMTTGFKIIITVLKPGEMAYTPINQVNMMAAVKGARRNATTVEEGTQYVVAIDKPLTDNIKISLPPLAGDPIFQAVFNSNGTAIGGKYNPATGMIDVRIKNSDTYMVKFNLKDFSDIQNKSVEMQDAIKVLASKGIIGGTSLTTFSPDYSITRVEIAALILRTLSKLDSKANGGFNDVKISDWYFGVAGSAKQYGIMNGLSIGIFAPKNTILKEQIIAVAARTLKNEMKYKDPVSIDSILGTYKDKSSIPSWGTKEIALATKENLVVKRTDSNFAPKGSMSRGDAAVILYRLFSKIW